MTAPSFAAIYVLADPLDGSVRYVGYTTETLVKRLNRHLAEARTSPGDSHRLRWLRRLQAGGLTPTIRELQVVPVEMYAEAERYWIAYHRALGCALVNSTDGGDGAPGYRFTPEQLERHRAKMAEPEVRAKLSAAGRGRVKSPEHVAKIAAANSGRPSPMRGVRLDEDERRRRYASRTGRTPSDETRAKMSAARLADRRPCPDCGRVFNAGNLAKHLRRTIPCSTSSRPSR